MQLLSCVPFFLPAGRNVDVVMITEAILDLEIKAPCSKCEQRNRRAQVPGGICRTAQSTHLGLHKREKPTYIWFNLRRVSYTPSRSRAQIEILTCCLKALASARKVEFLEVRRLHERCLEILCECRSSLFPTCAEGTRHPVRLMQHRYLTPHMWEEPFQVALHG